MIVLLTDYGPHGPYLGQVEAVLSRMAPDQKIITLFPDLPPHNPRAAAYLLAAYSAGFPPGTIFLCVVDPGVGSFTDDPVVMNLDQCWYVGPDNGLFDIVARRAHPSACRRIDWRPQQLSASFHGRDLYAPVCAMLATGTEFSTTAKAWRDRRGWPDDLDEIVYLDGFGNCMTGRRASTLTTSQKLMVNQHVVAHARTFAAAPAGAAFWYENSSGLVELAVNGGSAQVKLGLSVGSVFSYQ